jgi:hypothetical protein
MVDALNEHQKIAFENEKRIAIATRVGQFADKKEWRRYLKRKG